MANLAGWLIGLLIAAGIAPAAALATERSNPNAIAVIVANSEYRNEIPHVDYAGNDGDAMRSFFIDVLGYRDGNIIDLRNAGQAEILAVFGNEKNHQGKLWSWIKPGRSDVFVYYSGHGAPGLQDKRGYLLPVDSDPATVEINGYPLDLLYRNLAKLKARSVTVLLDACFSGASEAGMLIKSASPVFVKMTENEVAPGITVLSAAAGDQLASWDRDAELGLFTNYVLKGLRGRADGGTWGNGDGQVTLAEVRAYLDDEMSYAARRRFSRVQQVSAIGDPKAVLVAEVPEEPKEQVAAVATPSKPRPNRSGRRIGERFRDCAQCPEMVVVPAGSFVMGSTLEEQEWVISNGVSQSSISSESPRHEVTIEDAFAVGRMEVTVGEWRHYHDTASLDPGNGCWILDGVWEESIWTNWTDPGFAQSEKHPITCVSWRDAKSYVQWLSDQTGKDYRLLTEAEWEYVARANTTTYRYWGNDEADSEGCSYANSNDQAKGHRVNMSYSCDDGYAGTAPVGHYRANDFDLHDTLGNVFEWVEDCWNSSYVSAPKTGKAYTSGPCAYRVLRGGSWWDRPGGIRAATRIGWKETNRFSSGGLRVARTLP